MNPLFDYSVSVKDSPMDIRSETLEPISSSSKRFVFRLDAAGNLDQNSVLLFKCVSNGPAANSLRANSVSGGLLSIKRATLQVGDYILNDTVDIGRIATLTTLMKQNEATRNQFSGHYYQNSLHTEVLEAYDAATSQQGGTGTIVYDKHRSGTDMGDLNNNNANAAVNSCPINATAVSNQQFGISLGTILPCLKNRSLPLYLFQEYRILITIEFNDGEEWVNNILSTGAGGNAPAAGNNLNQGMVAGSNQVLYSDVKLQVDYIILPSEIQAEARAQTNAQGGLRLDFFDIIKVEKHIPAATANVLQSVEHRIGADNKEVHKIYQIKRKIHREGADNLNRPISEDRLFISGRCDGMNQEEYNVNIDGSDIFQDYKWAPSSQYDEVSNCLGVDLQVPRPVYYCDENTINSRLAEPLDGLLGKYKPLCLDLANGEPTIVGGGRTLGAYPIIWKYRRKPLAATANPGGADSGGNPAVGSINTDFREALEVDYFLMVSRVANVKSTPQGTQVTVAY